MENVGKSRYKCEKALILEKKIGKKYCLCYSEHTNPVGSIILWKPCWFGLVEAKRWGLG